jgi:2-(1,2-epoxy-1,2-dihydrophenyl)acetyl-CoA isomerase
MSEHSYESILFDYRGGVGVVTLNRPDRLNSFTAAMHGELAQAFAFMAARDDLRGVVITGAGRGFCAGQDLNERKPLPPGETRDLSQGLKQFYEPLIKTIRALPVPVVALVNGVAAGAGLSLALACDVVIAIESAKFIQAFSKIGLVPDAGGTYFVPRLVGTARAMGASLFGDAIGGRQAEQWGLIWQCVADDERDATLEKVVSRLASGPTRAYGATKLLIHASAGNSLAEQLDLEAAMQKEMGLTADYLEGMTAFAAKRQPQFQGK